MSWIKNRIDSEYKKHKDLDWSKIADIKISNTIYYILEEWFKEESDNGEFAVVVNKYRLDILKEKLLGESAEIGTMDKKE